MRCIDHDFQPVQPKRFGEGQLGKFHITLGGAFNPLGPPDLARRGQVITGCHTPFDGRFIRVGQLKPVRPKELDPVVVVGVM